MEVWAFRAWHKNEKKMYEVSGFEIVLEGQGKAKVTLAERDPENKYHTHWTWMSEVIIMRATPILDSKGLLIFEQDIILLDNAYWAISFGDWKIPIKNSNIIIPNAATQTNICGVGYYLLNSQKGALIHMEDVARRGTVVGNAFENEYLLKLAT